MLPRWLDGLYSGTQCSTCVGGRYTHCLPCSFLDTTHIPGGPSHHLPRFGSPGHHPPPLWFGLPLPYHLPPPATPFTAVGRLALPPRDVSPDEQRFYHPHAYGLIPRLLTLEQLPDAFSEGSAPSRSGGPGSGPHCWPRTTRIPEPAHSGLTTRVARQPLATSLPNYRLDSTRAVCLADIPDTRVPTCRRGSWARSSSWTWFGGWFAACADCSDDRFPT